MEHLSRDDGVITALLLRLREQRLPRLFGLQHKVCRGDPLNDYDIAFLNTVCYESKQCHAICGKYHEYDELFCKVAHFYHEIAQIALRNEMRLH